MERRCVEEQQQLDGMEDVESPEQKDVSDGGLLRLQSHNHHVVPLLMPSVLEDVQNDSLCNNSTTSCSSKPSIAAAPLNHHFLLMDMQGEALYRKTSAQDNSVAHLTLEDYSSDKTNGYGKGIASSSSCLPPTAHSRQPSSSEILSRTSSCVEPWGSIDWNRSKTDDKITFQPQLHVGYHILEGEKEALKSEIAVVRLVEQQRSCSPQNGIIGDGQQSMHRFVYSSKSGNSHAQLTGKSEDYAWEVHAIVQQKLVFKTRPILDSSKLEELVAQRQLEENKAFKQEKENKIDSFKAVVSQTSSVAAAASAAVASSAALSSRSNSSSSEKETTYNDSLGAAKAQNDDVFYEDWELVLSPHFPKLQESWRLIVVNDAVSKSLQLGQRLWFKAPPNGATQGTSMVLCSPSQTYTVERNELDGSVLICFKICRSRALEEISEESRQGEDESSGNNSSVNGEQRVSVSIIGVCRSVLCLEASCPFTIECNHMLQRNPGLMTEQLLHDLQASPYEIQRYLTAKSAPYQRTHTASAGCFYFKGRWMHINVEDQYAVVQLVFDVGTAAGIRWNQKITVEEICSVLRQHEAEEGMEWPGRLPLEPSIVYQFLQICCDLESPFQCNSARKCEEMDDCSVAWDKYDEIFYRYLNFLDNQEAICDIEIKFNIKKLQRLICHYVLLTLGEGIEGVPLEEYLLEADKLLQLVPWEVQQQATRQHLRQQRAFHRNPPEDAEMLPSDIEDEEAAAELEECDERYLTQGFPDLRDKITRPKLSEIWEKFKGSKASDMTAISGLGYLDANTECVYSLPEWSLHISIRERLMQLFNRKKRWHEEELKDMLQTILLPNANLTQTIAGAPLRHCRTNVVTLWELKNRAGEVLEKEDSCVFSSWNLPAPDWPLN